MVGRAARDGDHNGRIMGRKSASCPRNIVFPSIQKPGHGLGDFVDFASHHCRHQYGL